MRVTLQLFCVRRCCRYGSKTGYGVLYVKNLYTEKGHIRGEPLIGESPYREESHTLKVAIYERVQLTNTPTMIAHTLKLIAYTRHLEISAARGDQVMEQCL